MIYDLLIYFYFPYNIGDAVEGLVFITSSKETGAL